MHYYTQEEICIQADVLLCSSCNLHVSHSTHFILMFNVNTPLETNVHQN